MFVSICGIWAFVSFTYDSPYTERLFVVYKEAGRWWLRYSGVVYLHAAVVLFNTTSPCTFWLCHCTSTSEHTLAHTHRNVIHPIIFHHLRPTCFPFSRFYFENWRIWEITYTHTYAYSAICRTTYVFLQHVSSVSTLKGCTHGRWFYFPCKYILNKIYNL